MCGYMAVFLKTGLLLIGIIHGGGEHRQKREGRVDTTVGQKSSVW